MKQKQQIFLIHGGTPYENRKEYFNVLKESSVNLDWIKQQKEWKTDLYKDLGEGFEVYYPQMPNKQTAQYREWKVVFENILKSAGDDIILVGHSLGALLLVKYLSEEIVSNKIKKTILLGTPYDDEGMDNEPLLSFTLKQDFKLFEKQAGETYLYHSEDDSVVPFSHLNRYKNVLPDATYREFKDRNHFIESLIPELIVDIKS